MYKKILSTLLVVSASTCFSANNGEKKFSEEDKSLAEIIRRTTTLAKKEIMEPTKIKKGLKAQRRHIKRGRYHSQLSDFEKEEIARINEKIRNNHGAHGLQISVYGWRCLACFSARLSKDDVTHEDLQEVATKCQKFEKMWNDYQKSEKA